VQIAMLSIDLRRAGWFSLFICLGLTGCIIGGEGAPLGGEWTRQEPTTPYTLYDVMWTGNQLVAVGQGGTILTSPDGTEWSVRDSGRASTLLDVEMDSAGRMVAVGTHGTVLTSNDGIVWSKWILGTGSPLNSVSWTGNQFFISGQYGDLLSSPDGLEWTVLDSASNHSGSFSLVRWVYDRYFRSTCLSLETSSDAKNWTSRGQSTYSDCIGNVMWTGKYFAVVGSRSTRTSSDGLAWVKHPDRTELNDLYSITQAGTRWVGVGEAGAVWTSSDLIAWKQVRPPTYGVDGLPSGYATMNAVAWTGSKLIAVGFAGQVYSSP
jgi:photosystem II stability/assembly factor-like uncharacterized protein